MLVRAAAFFVALRFTAVLASSPPNASQPRVHLDNAIFFGRTDGPTDAYLGIKFAEAPRFRLPVPVEHYTGVHLAHAFGPACPQQGTDRVQSPVNNPEAGVFVPILNAPPERTRLPAEDCLFVNVWAPTGTNSSARLPVVVWIYGGAFQSGASDTYTGRDIVRRSMDLDEAVVYVSLNYRASAFGFLAGREVKAAGVGNIGLEDQRAALGWIQKYIGAFGGDPTRVTIWGVSSGAISASLQMLTNGGNTEGLFHGAFLHSGAPIPVGDISHGQPEYDALVNETLCGFAFDTLECLRDLPYEVLKSAVDLSPPVVSYRSLHLSWLPRVDGRFLTDTPQNLVLQGSVANVPHVSGNSFDEGTLFSIGNFLAVQNDTQFREYMLSNYINGATEDDIGNLFDTLYPDDPAQGSPFGTGSHYALRQYKRLAAIQGDLVFQAPRRFFIEQTYNKQPTWTFLNRRRIEDAYAFLGVVHGSDISNVFGPGDMTDYLIHFVNHGNPNGLDAGPDQWPQYDTQSRHQLSFVDNVDFPLVVTSDVYRAEGFKKLTELSLKFPL